MQSQTKKKVNLDSATIASLLYAYPSKLLGAFYEMQSSFLIGIYKKYSGIETASIILCFARSLHLEIIRQREKNLDYDISLNNLWNNFNSITKPKEKVISIVKSTGVPKETTRRKMAGLIKKRFINRNENREYSLSFMPKYKESYFKSINEEIIILSKFIAQFANYLDINMNQKIIEYEIKSQFSFYWFNFLSCQLQWLKMWQNKINDIDLILISLQAVIPTLKHIDKHAGSKNLSLDELYKIVGKTDDKYKSPDTEISATSISDVSGIPRATCIRKLEKLVSLGLLIRNPKSKRYSVNQLTSARTKNVITKENVSQTIEIFSTHLSVMLNALTRFNQN